MKFDAETVLCNPGDTVIIPQMRGVLLRVKKGKNTDDFQEQEIQCLSRKTIKTLRARF